MALLRYTQRAVAQFLEYRRNRSTVRIVLERVGLSVAIVSLSMVLFFSTHRHNPELAAEIFEFMEYALYGLLAWVSLPVLTGAIARAASGIDVSPLPDRRLEFSVSVRAWVVAALVLSAGMIGAATVTGGEDSADECFDLPEGEIAGFEAAYELEDGHTLYAAETSGTVWLHHSGDGWMQIDRVSGYGGDSSIGAQGFFVGRSASEKVYVDATDEEITVYGSLDETALTNEGGEVWHQGSISTEC